MIDQDVTTHACPPPGSGIMPCCGRAPFEAPANHRMTRDSQDVNCRGRWTPVGDAEAFRPRVLAGPLQDLDEMARAFAELPAPDETHGMTLDELLGRDVNGDTDA